MIVVINSFKYKACNFFFTDKKWFLKISVCIDGWKGVKDYQCFYYDRDVYPHGYHKNYGITLQDEGTEGWFNYIIRLKIELFMFK